MDNDFYRDILNESMVGYAHGEVIIDSQNKPVDFVCLDINETLALDIGLCKENLINRKYTEIFPKHSNKDNYWEKSFANVAISGGYEEFEQYLEPLKKHYHIKVFSKKKNFFTVLLYDISAQLKVIEISKSFLENLDTDIDYNEINDHMRTLSGAKYSVFNLFDENGLDFTTKAISGDYKVLEKVFGFFGYSLIGKGWNHDPVRAKKIESNTVTVFSRLSDLTGDIINKAMIESLEKMYEIGQVAVIKIMNKNQMIGDFTLIMVKGEHLHRPGIVELFASQTGLFIEKKKADEKLRSTNDKIAFMSYHDQLTGLYNKRFFEEEMKRLDSARNLPISLVIMDVNGLKLMNDAFGHSAGDELLKKIAETTKKHCREGEIIARTGGDEMAIILPQSDSHKIPSFIQRIAKALGKHRYGFIELSVAFGFATKDNAEEDIFDVFRIAEEQMYHNKLLESGKMHQKTINSILKTLFDQNKWEEKHAQSVSRICANIGLLLGLDNDRVEELKKAGLMHDIGKITISKSILDKKEILSDSEVTQIRRHPEVGYHILSSVSQFASISEYVLAHHERWDGTGYPKGLDAHQIPLQARVIALAEAFDNMISDTPYRQAYSKEYAIEEINKNSGSQFDPEIVAKFIKSIE
ncbi:MAG: diguanylate cyclase [Eubacteriales bacterium]|nr:diguanylate cyclase [Eubacteriales bacterium]